uniref:Uncharacterized protein n=1 Tax=Arundo donax TaxID=35708 RepID=A0A0A9BKD5_ARUDO
MAPRCPARGCGVALVLMAWWWWGVRRK